MQNNLKGYLGAAFWTLSATAVLLTTPLPANTEPSSIHEGDEWQWNPKWSCDHNVKAWYGHVRKHLLLQWSENVNKLRVDTSSQIYEDIAIIIGSAGLGAAAIPSPLSLAAALIGASAGSLATISVRSVGYVHKLRDEDRATWNKLDQLKKMRENYFKETCKVTSKVNYYADTTTEDDTVTPQPADSEDGEPVPYSAVTRDRPGFNCWTVSTTWVGDPQYAALPLCDNFDKNYLTEVCVLKTERAEARRQVGMIKRLMNDGLKSSNAAGLTQKQKVLYSAVVNEIDRINRSAVEKAMQCDP